MVSQAIKILSSNEKIKYCSILLLLTISILLCIISGIILNNTEKNIAKKKGLKPKSFNEILGLNKEIFTTKKGFYKISIGLISSFIAGFISNFHLFFGINIMNKFFLDKNFDSRVQAGISNIYCNIFGSILGLFIGNSIKNHTGIIDTPLIADLIGITLGSITGLIFPKIIID